MGGRGADFGGKGGGQLDVITRLSALSEQSVWLRDETWPETKPGRRRNLAGDETWPELSRTLRCALRPAVAPGSDVVCGSRLGSACGVSPPTWYSLLEGATRCANFALQGACDGAVGPMLGKDSHPWGIGVLN